MLDITLSQNSLLLGFGILVTAAVLCLALTALMWATRSRSPALTQTLSFARIALLPTATILYICQFVLHLPKDSTTSQLLESIFWIEVLWAVLALIRSVILPDDETQNFHKIPALFIDLVRFAVIVVGAGLVIAGVWGKDFTGFIATLGIGSIVLGLALQDTLGSLMAGIALLFERPFQEGDWIDVGGLEGQVAEINWRAVRLKTRSQDLVIVPNSIIAKERISNYSRPTPLHATTLYVGFSYEDPPNKVRRVLTETALATRGVRSQPAPIVRTQEYKDFSINYQVKLFIDDIAALPDIEQDFMSRVWYATRRNRLTIPFPIRTVYKTDVPPAPSANLLDSISLSIRNVPIFSELSKEELDYLAQDALLEDFAAKEVVVAQGNRGDSLYIIRRGEALVTLLDSHHESSEIARLKPGQFFGEMALLTGEARSATVTALEDLQVIVIYKDSIKPLIERRSGLAAEIARIVEQRKIELGSTSSTATSTLGLSNLSQDGTDNLLTRIRRFLAVS